MKLKRIFSFFISCLLFVSISFESFASVQTPSDAVLFSPSEMESGIMPMSSMGTVTNTISSDARIRVVVLYYDDEGKLQQDFIYPTYVNGRWVFSHMVDGVVCQVNFCLYSVYNALPAPGLYKTSFDFASDFSFDYSRFAFSSQKLTNNVATDIGRHQFTSTEISQFSGDIYISPISVDLGSVNVFYLQCYIPTSQELHSFGGSFAWRFEKTSELSSIDSFGSNTTQDFQNSVSTTTNAIYDTLQELIQHISNQLAALWDQMYNLMHVPTMAKLNEILSALRAIANNSDISAVVDQIDESNKEQIANDNANTAKVEQAVEKHGNFIIDGLKGLFIPSDEYFKGYFDDLYTFFSDRFGFLSFPIDLLQRLADLFIHSDDVDCVLTLPSFEISGEQLLIAQSFNLTEFLETNFSMLLSAIRIVGDCIIIGAFVNLCSNKWDEVMKN